MSAGTRISTCSVLALAMAGLATPAFAQDTLPDDSTIVVTAQRRSEKSVDVPITITTITGQQLADAGINQLSDVARVSPALRFDSAAAFVQPTIRGVGTAVTSSGGGANVGIYVDGFYSPNPLAADFELMRLQSVQVLKGPQGTLFGRNTTGGAILLSTAEPSTEYDAEMTASYGRFNRQRYQGYATFGLSESIAADVEGMFSSGNGFVRNVTTGSNRDAAYKNWSIRTGLKADISDSVSVLLRYTHRDINDPTLVTTNLYTDSQFGPGSSLPSSLYTTNPNETATAGPSEALTNADAVQLTIKADLGFADLTSYSQYRNEKTNLVTDLDHTAANIFLLNYDVDNETISQEFLLTSHPGSPLQWTAGLFYFRNEDIWSTYIGTPTPTDRFARLRLGGSGTLTETYAAFADVTYEISPQLFLTGGLRYSHDKIGDAFYIPPFSGRQVLVPDLTGDKVTPRVVLRYKPTAKSSIYASYAKGYKAGVIDVGGNSANRVTPEDINAFEVGYKYADRGFSIDLSGYYYDYKDLQVSLFVVNQGVASARLVNAARSRIYGLEGQMRYEVTDNFDVNAGAAWTHARYRQFDNAPVYTRCTVSPIPCSPGQSFAVVPTTLQDVRMQRTPAFTANLGARYTAPLGSGQLALSGNLYYTSEFFFGPSGTQFPQEGYEVLGLRAEWTDESDRFSLAVYGDNVTNQRYRTQVQYNNFGVGSVWNYPVTYGLQIGVKY